jgi:type II secretory pathway component PulF
MSSVAIPVQGALAAALQWLRWRCSPLGRAATAFRKTRHDYYLYLGQLLRDSRGKSTMVDIFWKDAERFGSKPRGVLARHWSEQHQDGADLLTTWAGTIPEQDLMVIGAAVRAGGAGAIEDALDDAARLSKRGEQSKSQFLSTIVVGFIALGLAAAVIVGAPLFFLPLMQKSFSFVPLDMWGPKGRALMSLADFLGTWGPVMAVALVGLIAAGFIALPRWTGPMRAKFDEFFLPYRLYRDARAAEFLATLGAVLKKRGNVSLNLREGLELIRTGAGVWLADHCSRMLDVLSEPGGHNDADVLDSGLLSKDSVYYVADMMEALGPDEGLQVAGLRIETQIEKAIAKAANRLRIVMLITGVSTVFFMALWMNAVITELKAATALVFS